MNELYSLFFFFFFKYIKKKIPKNVVTSILAPACNFVFLFWECYSSFLIPKKEESCTNDIFERRASNVHSNSLFCAQNFKITFNFKLFLLSFSLNFIYILKHGIGCLDGFLLGNFAFCLNGCVNSEVILH